MAGAKEIRTKIASVKNTQKITGAMQMVAASKMRRAQDKMSQSRPYSKGLYEIIGHIAASHSEFHHPYMVEGKSRKQLSSLYRLIAAFVVVLISIYSIRFLPKCEKLNGDG